MRTVKVIEESDLPIIKESIRKWRKRNRKEAGTYKSICVPDTNWSKVKPDCCDTLAGAGIECSEGRPRYPVVSFQTCQHKRTFPCCSCTYYRNPVPFVVSASIRCVASNRDRHAAIYYNAHHHHHPTKRTETRWIKYVSRNTKTKQLWWFLFVFFLFLFFSYYYLTIKSLHFI